MIPKIDEISEKINKRYDGKAYDIAEETIELCWEMWKEHVKEHELDCNCLECCQKRVNNADKRCPSCHLSYLEPTNPEEDNDRMVCPNCKYDNKKD